MDFKIYTKLGLLNITVIIQFNNIINRVYAIGKLQSKKYIKVPIYLYQF